MLLFGWEISAESVAPSEIIILFLPHILKKKKANISTIYFVHSEENIKRRKGGKMALRFLLDHFRYDGTQWSSKFWMIYTNMSFGKMPRRKGI